MDGVRSDLPWRRIVRVNVLSRREKKLRNQRLRNVNCTFCKSFIPPVEFPAGEEGESCCCSFLTLTSVVSFWSLDLRWMNRTRFCLSKFYFFPPLLRFSLFREKLGNNSVRIFLFSFYRSSNFVTSFLEDKFFEIHRIRLTKLIRSGSKNRFDVS